MRFIWYNIILGCLLNWLIAPIAILFQEQANKRKGFLWMFLSDNVTGDKTWRPNLKNKFLRQYFWMLRNPMQNWYWKDYVEGTESDFSGCCKYKFVASPATWRTMKCKDTGDNHGRIIDFENSPFGKQHVTFKRTDKNGKVQNCYRKSTCIPYRFLWWIILAKRRSGHEAGLFQYNFTFPCYLYKNNKDGWQLWKNAEWKEITI